MSMVARRNPNFSSPSQYISNAMRSWQSRAIQRAVCIFKHNFHSSSTAFEYHHARHADSSSFQALVESTGTFVKSTKRDIAERFRSAAQNNDTDKALRILQEATKSNIVIPDSIYDDLLLLLSGKSDFFVAPIIIAIMEYILKTNTSVRISIIKKYVRMSQNFSDPLLRYGYQSLLRQYRIREGLNIDAFEGSIPWSVANLESHNYELYWNLTTAAYNRRASAQKAEARPSVMESALIKFLQSQTCLAEVVDLLNSHKLLSASKNPWLIQEIFAQIASSSDSTSLVKVVQALGPTELSTAMTRMPDKTLGAIFAIVVNEFTDLELAFCLLDKYLQRDLSLTLEHADGLLTLHMRSTSNSSVNDDFDFGAQALDLAHSHLPQISYQDLLQFSQSLSMELEELLANQSEASLIDSIAKKFADLSICSQTQTLFLNIFLNMTDKPSAVLRLYRRFMNHGFRPDTGTFAILAKAVYRLGGKKLAFSLYQEMHVQYEVMPTPKIMESLLLCQFVGRDCSSALYFLSQMAVLKIPMSEAFRTMLLNKAKRMGSNAFALQLTHAAARQESYKFPNDSALAKTSTNDPNYLPYNFNRDKHNSLRFTQARQC